MDAPEIPSTIARVTVYAEGARVTRVAKVDAAAAAGGAIRLGGLPLALDDDSVRVSARGATATGVRVALAPPAAEPHLAPPDDAELDAARLAAAQADAELARLDRALADLELLAAPERAVPDGPRPDWGAALAARLALIELRATREASLRAARAAAVVRADDARRARERVEDRARRASTARAARPHELRKAAEIALGEVGGDVELELEYLVPGARWAPSYVARLGGGQLRLEVRAVVAQRTGEDWRGVALTLSTAEAQRFTELPELPAAKIGRRQAPPPRAGWRPAPIGADALYGDWDRAFAARLPAEPEAEPPPEPAKPMPPLTESRQAYGAPMDLDPAAAFDELSRATPGSIPRNAPPMPTGMPVPMAAPVSFAPQMAKKSAGPARVLLGGVGAIGGAAAAAAGALVGAARGGGAMRDEPSPHRARKQGEARPEPELAAPDELVAPADLLAFGQLVLPGPRHRRRGALVLAPRRDRLLALYAQVNVAIAVDLDVIALCDRAIDDARALAPMPPALRSGWDTSYAYAFAADGALDVPSDGQWHAIALGRAAAPATIRHVVVPRETTDVFRVAELTSPLDAPLLPGPMDVYDGKDFVLTTPVEWVPPRGALTLGLGVDPQVKVTRNADYREESSGVLRGSLRLEHSVRITAENLGRRAIELEVRERVPVVPDGEDDVEITVDGARPAWEPWEPPAPAPGVRTLRGGHRWRVAVEPTARVELFAHYQVKIAAKHELVGGNRREP